MFLKGGKIRHLPIPEPAFWHDLEWLILDREARAGALLGHGPLGEPSRLPAIMPSSRCPPTGCTSGGTAVSRTPGSCLTGPRRASGCTKHAIPPANNMLDKTGNLKAVQKLLGHASISTTGDIYVDVDEEQLAAALMRVLEEDE